MKVCVHARMLQTMLRCTYAHRDMHAYKLNDCMHAVTVHVHSHYPLMHVCAYEVHAQNTGHTHACIHTERAPVLRALT